MQTYMNKRKTPDRAAPPVQEAAPSRSEMLRLSGAGAPQPMSPQLREKFEPGFGADFSNIRISRGHIPEELGVEAVAQGTDILLDERAGMDVLGHELAHVVQQAQGRVEGGFPVVENAALEHEADVMGERVSSGLTAQAGPQNGFGGETMTIAPMSAVSAPAQCKSGKSKEEKKMDKMQISSPTVLQPGQQGYQNGMLDSKALDRSRMEAATTHSVALSQMLSSMHDPAYMQKVMAHTGSTSEDIRTDMGKLVGADYARGAASLDTNGQMGVREQNMFRSSHMYNQNFARFIQGEMKQSSSQAIAAAKGSQLSRRMENGKNIAELPPSVVDQQFQAMADEATSSAPIMAAIDGFFSGMRSRNSTMSDEHLEGIMSNDVFLRGGNPQLVEAAVAEKAQDAEGAEKISALSMALQKKLKGDSVNLFPGRMSEVAPRRPDETRVPQRGPAVDAKRAERAARAAADPEASTLGMRRMFDESRAAAEAQQPQYEGLTRIFKDPKPAEAPPNYTGMKRMFDPEKAAQEAAAPSYQGMKGMFNEEKAAMEVQAPNYTGVKEMLREPKPSKPATELLPGEMQSMFSTARDERRADRAADQASSESSFTGNLLSMFCENRPKSLAEELGLPEAPIKQEYVEGLTEFDDFDEPEPQHSAVGGVPFVSGNQPKEEELRQLNLSPEEENELMQGVQVLDPANEIDPLASPPKKKRWWQFWK